MLKDKTILNKNREVFSELLNKVKITPVKHEEDKAKSKSTSSSSEEADKKQESDLPLMELRF